MLEASLASEISLIDSVSDEHFRRFTTATVPAFTLAYFGSRLLTWTSLSIFPASLKMASVSEVGETVLASVSRTEKERAAKRELLKESVEDEMEMRVW